MLACEVATCMSALIEQRGLSFRPTRTCTRPAQFAMIPR